MKEFLSGKTLTYVNKADSADWVKWSMKAIPQGLDTLFTSIVMDSKHGLTDIDSELLCNGRSKMIAYTLYDYTDSGMQVKTRTRIVDSAVFTPGLKAGDKLEWKICFYDFRSNGESSLSKHRTLSKTDGNFQTFSDELELLFPDKSSIHYSAIMTYQKGIGLVEYVMTLPGNKVKDYVLVK